MSFRNTPRPPRTPRSGSNLRLTGDRSGGTMLDEPKGTLLGGSVDSNDFTDDAPGPIPFPPAAAGRGRLLAGAVRLLANPELATHDPVIGRIGHDRMVRSIEATLIQMQDKLDHLDADVDTEIESSLKFPIFDNDLGPRAA